MAYPFPPELGRLVQEGLAAGGYTSEDDLLLEAMLALRDRDEAVVGIRQGLADLEAGRVHPLGEVDAQLRQKHGIAQHMTYQIVIAEKAARELEDAYLWIAARAPEAAALWYNSFVDALNTLCANPERCPLAAESRRVGAEVRELLYGRRHTYRALFTIRHRTVVVLHIRHAARREASPEDIS